VQFHIYLSIYFSMRKFSTKQTLESFVVPWHTIFTKIIKEGLTVQTCSSQCFPPPLLNKWIWKSLIELKVNTISNGQFQSLFSHKIDWSEFCQIKLSLKLKSFRHLNICPRMTYESMFVIIKLKLVSLFVWRFNILMRPWKFRILKMPDRKKITDAA